MFEEGEDTREAGERLAASYVNFYIGNEVVLVPQFGDEHDVSGNRYYCRSCSRSVRSCQSYAREIIIGGGNIHCITQQIPVREMTDSRKSYKVSLQDRWKDKNAGFQNKQE